MRIDKGSVGLLNRQGHVAGGSSSNWILMSCQPHRVTSGQSNSDHKQIHISKLFSYIYIYIYISQPSVNSIYKTNHFANIKHTQTSDANIRRVSPFSITFNNNNNNNQTHTHTHTQREGGREREREGERERAQNNSNNIKKLTMWVMTAWLVLHCLLDITTYY